jgi:hypothetical protein
VTDVEPIIKSQLARMIARTSSMPDSDAATTYFNGGATCRCGMPDALISALRSGLSPLIATCTNSSCVSVVQAQLSHSASGTRASLVRVNSSVRITQVSVPFASSICRIISLARFMYGRASGDHRSATSSLEGSR